MTRVSRGIKTMSTAFYLARAINGNSMLMRIDMSFSRELMGETNFSLTCEFLVLARM